jgi:hypothetical protein
MNLFAMLRRPLGRAAWLGILVLAACGRPDTVIHVAIRDVDGRPAPVAKLRLVILPYDRDSVLAALESRSRTPRPDTMGLDSLFSQVRQPFGALLRATWFDRRLRDSLEDLRRRTAAEPRGSARYRELYLAFATAADSLGPAQQRLVEANRVAGAAYRRVGARLDQLRLVMTRWEDSTFRSYDSDISALTAQLGRRRQEVVTGADGRAAVRLPQGKWWIYARAPDPADPNAGWYWNVPVGGDSIALDPGSAQHRPCYTTRCP